MSDPAQTDVPLVIYAVEALLFAGGPPLTIARMAESLDGVAEDAIVRSIAELNQQYHQEGRPYEIRRVDTGFQMRLRPNFLPVARRLHGRSRDVRLSIAALDVLAIVAYRQPVDLATIDAIRGIDSGPIVRLLRKRNLIEATDPEPAGVRSSAFQTTRRFLELFHLRSLDELPRVQDLERG